MKTNLENILVFATNIRTENDKKLISKILEAHQEVKLWNIDQEDIDCVLRIESNTLSEEQIIDLIAEYNFICKALE